MAHRNSRTQSSRRACCNDWASAPTELASRVFVNSRTNAGMITRSRKSLRAGSSEACVSQLVSDLRGSRLPSGARGISSSQTTKPSPCTRSDVCALAILRRIRNSPLAKTRRLRSRELTLPAPVFRACGDRGWHGFFHGVCI